MHFAFILVQHEYVKSFPCARLETESINVELKLENQLPRRHIFSVND